MSVEDIWKALEHKLIAILRGIEPDEVEPVVSELLVAGFCAIEIPLNSPSPFRSIEIASEVALQQSSGPCLIGAGTVLSLEEVHTVRQAGGNLVVSPNVDPAVIEQTKSLGMFSAPGVFTPTECLTAVNAGADCLKIFPASNLGISGFRSLSAVLPKSTQLCAVGGVGSEDFGNYLKAGAVAFGLGSSLYSPGMAADEVALKAQASVEAYRKAIG